MAGVLEDRRDRALERCVPSSTPGRSLSFSPEYASFYRIFPLFLFSTSHSSITFCFLVGYSLRSFKKVYGTSRIFFINLEQQFPTLLHSTVGDTFSPKLQQTGKKLIFIKRVLLLLSQLKSHPFFFFKDRMRFINPIN